MNNPEKAQDYRSAVMKCTQCQELGACQKFLEHNGQAAQVPDYCVNAALFEKLQNG